MDRIRCSNFHKEKNNNLCQAKFDVLCRILPFFAKILAEVCRILATLFAVHFLYYLIETLDSIRKI